MSKSLNQAILAWKVVCCHSRRYASRKWSKVLKWRDVVTYSDTVLLWGLTSYELLDSQGGLSDDQWEAWCRDALSFHPSELGLLCKRSLDYLRNTVAGRHDRDTCSFKHCTGWGQSPVLRPVLPLLTRFFTGDASTFRMLNQFFSFPTRCNLRSLDYSKECMEAYYADEAYLAERTLPDRLIPELRSIMEEWMSGFCAEDWNPKHGSGEVAFLPHASLEEKYKDLRVDWKVRYWLRDELKFLVPVANTHKLCRAAEVDFVPKSLQTWRVISKEPASLMYFQQAVWAKLDTFMRDHPVLRQHIRLHDDSFNRMLAREGSADSGRLATIDLSSASDLVGWDLVKAVFSHTALFRAILACRSTHAVLPNGELLELKKFAPMGSALCFPIECLIFAGICEMVARLHPSRRVTYAVYGDDMIIDQDLAPDLVYLLEAFGFRVNASKSFIAANLPFRESCGGEFYYGEDVSPLRISRKFRGLWVDMSNPGTYGNLIDLANELGRYGCRVSRSLVIQRLLVLPVKLRPIFGTSLATPSPTNHHLLSFYHKSWQTEMFWCGQVTAQIDKRGRDEAIRLYEWLRSATNRVLPRILKGPQDVVVARIDRTRTVIKAAPAHPPSQEGGEDTRRDYAILLN